MEHHIFPFIPNKHFLKCTKSLKYMLILLNNYFCACNKLKSDTVYTCCNCPTDLLHICQSWMQKSIVTVMPDFKIPIKILWCVCVCVFILVLCIYMIYCIRLGFRCCDCKNFFSLQLQSSSNKAIKTRAGKHTEAWSPSSHKHTHFPLVSCFKWELANTRTSVSLSLSLSLLLSHTPSISLNYFSTLLPSFFLLSVSTFSRPSHLHLLPVPMPNGFEQGSQPPHPLTSLPSPSERNSIGLEANQSQRVLSCDWIWPGQMGWDGWAE